MAEEIFPQAVPWYQERRLTSFELAASLPALTKVPRTDRLSGWWHGQTREGRTWAVDGLNARNTESTTHQSGGHRRCLMSPTTRSCYQPPPFCQLRNFTMPKCKDEVNHLSLWLWRRSFSNRVLGWRGQVRRNPNSDPMRRGLRSRRGRSLPVLIRR